MKRMLVIAIGIVMFMSGAAMADSKPIQLSLTPGVAIFDRTTAIEGFSLGIWSENPQKAFALGFANGSTGNSAGFSLGFILNYAESYKGVQWSLVNYAGKDFTGWQSALVNYVDDSFTGFQSGLVNYAGQLAGLQLGLFNYAAKASGGVQIGLVNIISQNKWFANFPNELAPGMIIFNWRF
ncbi:MAG: hypothetical protein QM278_02715 [Pseudomonadota bacterium]|nr:hypothetical protein [Pseudomonadota bacterium]